MYQIIFTVIAVVIIAICTIVLLPELQYNMDDEYCSVCASYAVENSIESENYNGYFKHKFEVESALEDIWNRYNYGEGRKRTESHLNYLEDIRIKESIDSVPSFLLIDFDNPCPRTPNLEWVETGIVKDVIEWDDDWDDGYAYNHVIMESNNTYDNTGNKNIIGKEVFVFRKNGFVWGWNFHEARVVLVDENPNYANNINTSWDEYYKNYQTYLDNGDYAD